MSQNPQDTSGTAMAIQGLVQSVDLVTDALERKWGVGRLRLLVAQPALEGHACGMWSGLSNPSPNGRDNQAGAAR